MAWTTRTLGRSYLSVIVSTASLWQLSWPQLFLELRPGVLFSAEAADQIGVIKASQESGGEDYTTIAFDVFRWRVDDLMFYINEE